MFSREEARRVVKHNLRMLEKVDKAVFIAFRRT